MKRRVLITTLLIGVLAYADLSAGKSDRFAPANDFPRGALLYVQVSDLPGLIKLWNDSTLGTKYLESTNFEELTRRHLGLKLASRWHEFNDAAGVKLDLESLAGLTGGQAAFALYDIGRLDFLFVAPVSAELFRATVLMQNRSRFDEEELSEDIHVYRVKVAADRDRQKQELLFTNINGKLLVATSESLMSRTIANLKRNARKDRLSDEPAFTALSERIEPHAMTVWTDQAALNDDYYFKRYWLMGNTEDVKKIRAGMFDIEISEGKFTERRDFVLNEMSREASISRTVRQNAVSRVPGDIPYYRLRAGSQVAVTEAVSSIIAMPRESSGDRQESLRSHYSLADFDFDGDDDESISFGRDFDENINERETTESSADEVVSDSGISKVLAAAHPVAVLGLTSPEVKPAPLFAEFKRAAVFQLGAINLFDRGQFESAFEHYLVRHVTVATGGISFQWETKTKDGVDWREITLPMIGWTVSYVVTGDQLFLANDRDLLQEVVRSNNTLPANSEGSVSELAMLDVSKLEPTYRETFGRLALEERSSDFFTGNIASIISLGPGPTTVRFTRKFSGRTLHDELQIISAQLPQNKLAGPR